MCHSSSGGGDAGCNAEAQSRQLLGRGAFVATLLQRRKVLVLSGGPYVRNLLALLEQVEGHDDIGGDTLLDTVNRQNFDAIVLELRWPDVKSNGELPGIKQISPAWEGNLLVITADINGPDTLEMIEQYLINGLPQTIPPLAAQPFHPAA